MKKRSTDRRPNPQPTAEQQADESRATLAELEIDERDVAGAMN